uniref:Uncharacterized protein n=1 Tax=Parascaris equorum TaxID=6256 RepID=A0A914RRR9_PAREQ
MKTYGKLCRQPIKEKDTYVGETLKGTPANNAFSSPINGALPKNRTSVKQHNVEPNRSMWTFRLATNATISLSTGQSWAFNGQPETPTPTLRKQPFCNYNHQNTVQQPKPW